MSPSVRDVGFLVKLIYDAINRTVNRELSMSGLTNSQVAVLAYLISREGNRTTMKDVQTFLNVSHPTVAGLVKRLEKKGYLHVLIDPDDKRARILYLDTAMEAAFSAAQPPTLEMEEILLRGLSKQEREQLCMLLTRVYENVR